MCVFNGFVNHLSFHSDMRILSRPQRATSITVLLRAAAALSQPLLGVKLRSSVAFHPFFVILVTNPAKQSNSNNTQGKVSSLVAVLLLLKFLQSRTERYDFLRIRLISTVQYILYSRWLSLDGQEGSSTGDHSPRRRHR